MKNSEYCRHKFFGNSGSNSTLTCANNTSSTS
jgi:hypothetical protein